LQFPKYKSAVTVSGIGEARFRSDECMGMVNINLKSQTSEFASANIATLVAPTITVNQPNLTVNSEDWKIPANLRLADSQFFRPQKIDLLIGARGYFL